MYFLNNIKGTARKKETRSLFLSIARSVNVITLELLNYDGAWQVPPLAKSQVIVLVAAGAFGVAVIEALVSAGVPIAVHAPSLAADTVVAP
jgi:hypothetical protein